MYRGGRWLAWQRAQVGWTLTPERERENTGLEETSPSSCVKGPRRTRPMLKPCNHGRGPRGPGQSLSPVTASSSRRSLCTPTCHENSIILVSLMMTEHLGRPVKEPGLPRRAPDGPAPSPLLAFPACAPGVEPLQLPK